MANLQKFRAHESLNISSAATFELQTVNSQDTSSEEASIYGDLSGYHTIFLQPSEDIYYGFSSSTTAMLGTANNNLYLKGGDTIYELAIPHGVGSTIYLHTLAKTSTSAIRWALS
jgi:hypothetical protein